MEAIQCSFPSLSIPSFLTNKYPNKGRTNLLFLAKRKLIIPSVSPLRTRALEDALGVATSTPKAPGGDVSVLLPVSALLLFMYWISNFIIPGIIVKDLQSKASEREESSVSEQQTNGSFESAGSESEPEKPKKKFKKEDIKKMMRQR